MNWVIIHPCLPGDSLSVYICYLCVLITISPFYSQVSGLDDGFLWPYVFINDMHLFQIPVCIESVMNYIVRSIVKMSMTLILLIMFCSSEMWLPTPVFLPGEFHGQRSLESVGSQRVGHN